MEDIEWNVVNEGQLLDAMVGHKPVGVNKYFQMAIICDKFSDSLNKDIDPQKIWAHLETMYNLEVLDENESIPFPNSEREFSLPESEFGVLLSKKDGDDKKSGRETPKLSKEIKKEDKTLSKNHKESTPRRDSKEGKDNNKTPGTKKEIKKESDKGAKHGNKGRNSISALKEDKGKDTPKPTKRTRGSLKSNDDSGSSGKSSPVTVTPTNAKRRRI